MFLAIFFFLAVPSIAASEVWDLGCYSDSRTNREFRVSAGSYKVNDTSVQQCTSSCAYGNYRYKFAATEGSYCYCSDTMDKVVKQSDSNKCNSVCTDDVCAGPAYIRIFNTSVSIEGLTVNTPGTGFLLEDVAFSSSIAKGARNVTYTFNFGDKSFVLSTCCNISHKYTKTGFFKVKVSARNSESGPIYRSEWVSIESALGLVRLKCPEHIVESGNNTKITVSTTQGTRLRAKFLKKGDTTICNMSDALMFEVGSKATFGNMSGSPVSDGAYIKPTSMLKRAGRIMAWELYASKIGIVRLQVYRPVCPVLTPFCPSNFTCMSGSCKSTMQFSCPGAMCLYTGKCVQGCKITPAVFPSSASTPLVSYKLIGEVIVKITKVGYNLFTLKPSDSIETLAGDVIGWSTNSSSGDIAYENSLSDPEFFYPSSSFTIAVGSTLANTGDVKRQDISHVIRAHVSQESLASTDFVFNEAGSFNVSVVVENRPVKRQESQLEFCTVSVQDRITDLEISEPLCHDKSISYAAGYLFKLNASITKGSNVTYLWSVDGKTLNGKTAETQIDDIGLHNVFATASNNISSCSISTVISVLNEVGAISFNHSLSNVVDAPVNFTVSVAKGTNVTLKIKFNGEDAQTFYIPEANNTPFEFSHSFTVGGNKEVKIIASNNIEGDKGKQEKTKTLYVKGKIGEITTEVRPQLTCANVLEIATGQEFDISAYSSLSDIAINYTIDDGVSGVLHVTTLTGKVNFNRMYKKDFEGNISINASANGEVIPNIIPVKVSRCGPAAIFKPTSYSSKNPMVITKANELELKYTSELKEKEGCTYTGRLVYTWKVFKLQDDSPVEVPNFQPVYGFASPTFKAAPGSLEEGNYTINMSLTNTQTGQCYKYQTFITVRKSNLFCVIKGGSQRVVAYKNDEYIVLDGSSSVDPDEPNKPGLSYHWKCRRTNDSETNEVFSKPWHQKHEQFCNTTTFEDVAIGLRNSLSKLPVEHFRENATYEFQLYIKKDDREKSCSQRIQVLPESMPTISIECKSNCRDKVNPFDRLILSAICTNCRNSTDQLEYSWSLRDGNNNLDSRSGNLSLVSTGWNKMSIVLLADTFKEKSEYTLQVEITRRSQSVYALYYFVTTSRPSDGTCQVIPEKGYNIESKFKIVCEKWTTEDPQIDYEFHYIHKANEDARINSLPTQRSLALLWYFGRFRETPAISLPIGDENDQYRLPLYVKIINRFGAYAKYHLNVTVLPLSSKTTNVKVKIDEIKRQLQQSTKQDPQTVIAVVTAASSFINSQDTKNEVSKEKVEQVRYDMVKKLAEVKPQSLPMISEQCNALSSAIENKDEVTSKAQLLATESIKRSSDVLKNLAKEGGYDKKSPINVEETAQSVLSPVSRVFAASEATTEDYLTQVIENLQKEKNAPKSRDWSVRIREWKGEDSAGDAEKVVGDLYDSLNKITSAIQENKVEGETDTLVTTKTFGIQLSKSPFSEIQNATLPVRGCDSSSEGSFVLPKGEHLIGKKYDGETVGVQIVCFKENPVRWDEKTSAFMNSSVIGLELKSEKDEEIVVKDTVEDIEIWLPVKVSSFNQYSSTFQSKTFHTYHYRISNDEAMNDPLLIHIKPNKQLTMYLQFGAYPSTTDYTLMLNLPILNDSLPWPYTRVDNYTFLVHDLNLLGKDVFLGVRATELIKSQGLEAPGDVGSTEVTQLIQINYTMDIRSVGCRFWSEKKTETWSKAGCKVGNKTTYSEVQCLCNHLTFFGPVDIKPNPIGKPTIEKLKKGFVSLIAVCIIFLLYFIALIWARRKDRADAIKVGACPLPDNDPTDQFRYEVTLWTSMRRYGGTTSKVNIILCGEDNDSEPRTLEDPERKPFQRGSVDTFLLTTPYMLGSLPYIRIWHDNSGGSWFLSRVMVVDLQNDDHHYFICNRWLAVDEDDGQVERLIPLASKEELTEFQHLFVARTRRNLSDSHLWFSVFARPASSRFTRVQRLTCCLCLLMMSMMASCMYYKDKGTPNAQNAQNFAGMTITWNDVVIGVLTSLIVFPVSLFVVQIFRSVRPKPHRVTHRKIPMPPKLSLTVNNLASYNKMKDSSDDSKGSNNSIDSTQEKNNAKMRLSINDVHTDVDRISFTSSPLLVDNRRGSTMWETTATNKFGRIAQWFKRHSSLPYYFVYVAWFLAVALTLGASLVIILYGMEFGNDVSLKWLFASAVSFIQDVIITQPLKVLGTAMFFALVVKKPDKGEFEVSNDAAQLAEDEDWLYQGAGDQKRNKKKRKAKLLPPDEAKLIAMRSTRMKERKMYSVIREVGSFYIFLCLVMMIAYTHKDFYSFVQNNEVKKLFVNDFVQIDNDHNFWNWTREHLMPNLFPSEWYNGQKLKPDGFLSDKYNQMVGGARLRHIRVKNETCIVPPPTTFLNRECFGEYTMSDEETQDFLVSWSNVTKYQKPVSRKDASWRYQDWQTLDGYPVWAQLDTYSGGGYVLVIEPGMDNMANLAKLESEYWIDRHTRAVITEFTVYNAQTNLFTILTLVAEFPATGGFIPYVNIHTARLYNYTQDYMFFVLGCECLFVLFILYFLYREVRKIFKEGTPHFKQFWNIVELVIVISAGIGIGLYIYRLLNFSNVLEKSRNAPFQFKSFQVAAYWDESYTLTIAILVTFSTIKLNKLLRFNKRMSLLSSTLKNAAFSLAMFGLIFGILFLAFTLIGTVVFGTTVKDYRQAGSSFTSLLSLMLGKTSFLEMNEANRVIGPLYFFCFMFLVSMVLINMFLSIIIDSYHEVKRDLEKQNNEYEIVDFIIERFKMWSGIGKAQKPQFQSRHVKWDAAHAKVKTIYAFRGDREDYITALENRLETLMKRTDQLFCEVFPERVRRSTKADIMKAVKPDHRL